MIVYCGFARGYSGGTLGKCTEDLIVLFFNKLHANLQLSQNKKFN